MVLRIKVNIEPTLKFLIVSLTARVSTVLTPFGLSYIADVTRGPLQKRNKLSMSRRQYLTDHRLPTQTLQDLGALFDPFDPKYG